MGPTGAIDAARALGAGSALRAWGDAIATSIDDLGRLPGLTPPALEDGLQLLRPVSRGSVQSTGWELRHALAWRNDDRCIQRAAFAAMSLAEREGGGITPAIGQLARDDAMTSAMAVAYDPKFGNARFHAAAIARTSDDELVVIDHLFADADDGVLAFDEWLRRTGATRANTTILSPLRQPPMSIRSAGPGIPVFARARSGSDWRDFARHMEVALRESVDRRLPQVVPATR